MGSQRHYDTLFASVAKSVARSSGLPDVQGWCGWKPGEFLEVTDGKLQFANRYGPVLPPLRSEWLPTTNVACLYSLVFSDNVCIDRVDEDYDITSFFQGLCMYPEKKRGANRISVSKRSHGAGWKVSMADVPLWKVEFLAFLSRVQHEILAAVLCVEARHSTLDRAQLEKLGNRLLERLLPWWEKDTPLEDLGFTDEFVKAISTFDGAEGGNLRGGEHAVRSKVLSYERRCRGPRKVGFRRAWLALYAFGKEVKDAKLQVETVAPSALWLMAQQHLPRLHVTDIDLTLDTC